MKKVVLSLLSLLFSAPLLAQESQTEYNFLRLPVGGHAAALGGDNISVVEDDESFIFNNPALLSNVTDKTINLNYMNFMQSVNTGSAAFNKKYNDKSTFAVSAQMVDYGTMKEMDENNIQTGDFSAKDISVAGYLSYILGKKFTGGITAKFVYSKLGSYDSEAMCFDLGLNYYDPEKEFSASAVVKNLGGQFKAYDEEYESLPADVQVGISKKFEHTPFRVSATLVDLNHLNYKFINHAVVGVDILFNSSLWVGGGYNFRRANEMSIKSLGEEKGSSHGAGLSFGAGVNLDRFKLNVAYGKYHVSSRSIVVSAAFSL